MPAATVPGNAKGPLLAKGSCMLPLPKVTAVPTTSPLRVPVMLAEWVQVTVTLSTVSASAFKLPVPLATSHSCPTGCVWTVTA